MRKLPLSKGFFTVVDDEGFAKFGHLKWTYCKGYAIRRIRIGPRKENKSICIYLHREVLGLSREDKRSCDHINGDRLDNRLANLRPATHRENCCNMGKKSFKKETASRFKGVSWSKRRGMWRARVRLRGKEREIGCFALEEDAARAYDTAAREWHGEFARLNFPLSSGTR